MDLCALILLMGYLFEFTCIQSYIPTLSYSVLYNIILYIYIYSSRNDVFLSEQKSLPSAAALAGLAWSRSIGVPPCSWQKSPKNGQWVSKQAILSILIWHSINFIAKLSLGNVFTILYMFMWMQYMQSKKPFLKDIQSFCYRSLSQWPHPPFSCGHDKRYYKRYTNYIRTFDYQGILLGYYNITIPFLNY